MIGRKSIGRVCAHHRTTTLVACSGGGVPSVVCCRKDELYMPGQWVEVASAEKDGEFRGKKVKRGTNLIVGKINPTAKDVENYKIAHKKV